MATKYWNNFEHVELLSAIKRGHKRGQRPTDNLHSKSMSNHIWVKIYVLQRESKTNQALHPDFNYSIYFWEDGMPSSLHHKGVSHFQNVCFRQFIALHKNNRKNTFSILCYTRQSWSICLYSVACLPGDPFPDFPSWRYLWYGILVMHCRFL